MVTRKSTDKRETVEAKSRAARNPAQTALTAEREDLMNRRDELYDYLVGGEFAGLEPDDQQLLKDQYNLMGALLDVYNKRVERTKA